MSTTQNLLEVRDVSRAFGGVKAVNGLSFDVRQGEILGLIGPNGAGKTTVFNLISGIQHPDSGSIQLSGQPIAGLRPDQVCAAGISRTFQTASFLPGMSTYANVELAAAFRPADKRRRRSTAEVTEAALRATDLLSVAHVDAEMLNVSQQKKLEIARAMASEPLLMMTDEIVAGLNPTETNEVLDILMRLNAVGTTLVFVEHDVRAVLSLSNRLVVIAQGQLLAEGDPREVARSPEVIRVYLGNRYAGNH
ncbi:MAG TPA: ABC transporter ATP-binding protein [Burkholderiaceae bacterium]|nr:ABC transporter ATP-binding protein [Burkholderiaceae bacterium]